MIYPIMDPYGSNCYLIIDKKVILVDSGANSGTIKRINELTTHVDLLINTHCHYDHIANDLSIKGIGAKIAAHVLDASPMERADDLYVNAGLFGAACPKIMVDQKLKDRDVIELEKTKLQIIHTPGHTKGSICIYEPGSRSLFSGDTIFTDGIGRTDFAGGNLNELKNSVEELLKLRVDTLYPGHGPSGTGEDIKRVYNLFFGVKI